MSGAIGDDFVRFSASQIACCLGRRALVVRASPGKKLIPAGIDGRKKENSAPVPQIGGSDFDIHSVHAKPHAPILNHEVSLPFTKKLSVGHRTEA